MKKRLILSILAAGMLLAMLVPTARALGPSDSGTCGDNLTWTLENYVLTISGSGEMEDGCPWEEYKTKVEHVVLTGGVTKIGKEAFYGFDSLETVDFGDELVEIGEKAFYGCEDIDYIHLPATFRTFGAEAFRDCYSLKYVYCDGGMPRFNNSCLWTGNYISVFYPTNNPWPAESVQQLVSNFGGRLGIMMGNFDEASVEANLAAAEATEETEETEETTEETEETEETTEATTEAATEPTTEPATEPTTEPTTVPTTEPTTEPTTDPTTIPTETTVVTEAEETEESDPVQETAEKVGGDGWIGLVMVAGVFTFLIAGAMIFRSAKHKGGKYIE